MPFEERFTKLEHFIPDANFDPSRDLVRVEFKKQRLFASLLDNSRGADGQWGILLGDPTLSPSFTENLAQQPMHFKDILGFRIDKAWVGSVALFSVLGRSEKNTWASAEPVTNLEYVPRTKRLKSTLIIGKPGRLQAGHLRPQP